MSRKNKPLAPAVVVPTDSLTEVWAVTTYGTECHADDCYCDTGEGTTVVALFSSEQTATQFADRKNNGQEYGPYRAQKLPVHTAMKELY